MLPEVFERLGRSIVGRDDGVKGVVVRHWIAVRTDMLVPRVCPEWNNISNIDIDIELYKIVWMW